MRDLSAVVDRLSRAVQAEPRDENELAGALEEAIAAVREVPGADQEIDVLELMDSLADSYGRLGHTDDAIATMREAISQGYRSTPDPEGRIAELLMRGGREDEARPIWARMREQDPDDVWVPNNAGLEYAALGEDETALEWFSQATAVALESGDPERLIGQLAFQRGRCIERLDRDPDALQMRAEQAAEALRVARGPERSTFDDQRWDGERLVFAWFPEAEYVQAVARWPDISWNAGGDSYAEYRVDLQARLIGISAAYEVRRAWLAPITVDGLIAWCEQQGRDPAHSASRADYGVAADVRLRAWPPGRNDACWCGSDRKYKKCCGRPGLVD